MALEANFCRVRLENPGPAEQRLLLCTRRSRLAHEGAQVMVGDWVVITCLQKLLLHCRWPAGITGCSQGILRDCAFSGLTR